MHDLVIIGAGPAGLAAAIYGVRAGMDLVVLEQLSPGGQVMKTWEVENYPGFTDPIEGWDLMARMEGQARRLGTVIESAGVAALTHDPERKRYRLALEDGQTMEARTVIAATGASLRQLGVPGEAALTGRGVSYCATCDGAFFKDKVTAVVGGGNTALEEAFFLTRFAREVHIIHRRDTYRAEKAVQDRIMASPKVTHVYNSIVTAVEGDERVTGLVIRNLHSCQDTRMPVDGVFIFIGFTPNTAYLPPAVLAPNGEALADMNMRTPLPGLYAVGDLRLGSRRQIVTAVADGATAAMDAYEYNLSLT